MLGTISPAGSYMPRELLLEQLRVLGPSHPRTLITRGNIASWTGEVGKLAEALRLFDELLPDRVGGQVRRIRTPSKPTETSRHSPTK